MVWFFIPQWGKNKWEQTSLGHSQYRNLAFCPDRQLMPCNWTCWHLKSSLSFWQEITEKKRWCHHYQTAKLNTLTTDNLIIWKVFDMKTVVGINSIKTERYKTTKSLILCFTHSRLVYAAVTLESIVQTAGMYWDQFHQWAYIFSPKYRKQCILKKTLWYRFN